MTYIGSEVTYLPSPTSRRCEDEGGRGRWSRDGCPSAWASGHLFQLAKDLVRVDLEDPNHIHRCQKPGTCGSQLLLGLRDDVRQNFCRTIHSSSLCSLPSPPIWEAGSAPWPRARAPFPARWFPDFRSRCGLVRERQLQVAMIFLLFFQERTSTAL